MSFASSPPLDPRFPSDPLVHEHPISNPSGREAALDGSASFKLF